MYIVIANWRGVYSALQWRLQERHFKGERSAVGRVARSPRRVYTFYIQLYLSIRSEGGLLDWLWGRVGSFSKSVHVLWRFSVLGGPGRLARRPEPFK